MNVPAVPAWVVFSGYRQIGIRVPRVNEYYYDPLQNIVTRCMVEESQVFPVLEYNPTITFATTSETF